MPSCTDVIGRQRLQIEGDQLLFVLPVVIEHPQSSDNTDICTEKQSYDGGLRKRNGHDSMLIWFSRWVIGREIGEETGKDGERTR